MAVGTNGVTLTALVDDPFFADKIMITDAGPSFVLMPLMDVRGRMSGFYSRMMEYNVVSKSTHLERFVEI